MITDIVAQLRTTDLASSTAERLRLNVVRLEREVHETPWETREFVIKDDQGHTLHFGQPL
jgi:hypothetical protein